MNLDEMEALEKAATCGPWFHTNIEHDWCDEIYNEPILTNLENGIASMYGKGTPKSIGNAKFIAASRDFVPWAIKRIRELEKIAEAARRHSLAWHIHRHNIYQRLEVDGPLAIDPKFKPAESIGLYEALENCKE